MNMDTFGASISAAAPNNPGPVAFMARIGSPSPADPGAEQLVTDRPNTWLDTIRTATKSALSLVVGTGNSNAAIAAQGASAIGEGVKSAGLGIQKAATSAASGVKIGAAVLVVVLGIILLGYTRSALRAN